MRDLYNEVLYDFQKKVVDHSNVNSRYGLWLEMGLGKSYISLAIAQLRKKNKLLIISPKSKLNDWKKDVEDNLGLNGYILDSVKPAKDQEVLDNFTTGAIIVNYERAWRRNILELLDKDFIIILDESQNVKTRTSTVGKWIQKTIPLTDNILLLSGTPIANKITDWYNQLKLLGLNMKYKDFENEFAIMELMKMGHKRFNTYQGSKNEDKLHEAIKTQSSFLETKDAIDLPDQVISDIVLINEKQNIYNKVRRHSIYKDLLIETPGALFLRTRQLASGFIEEYKNVSNHKQQALKDLLNSSNNNTLVFYNFNQELEDIKAIAKELEIKVFEINGHNKNFEEAKEYEGRYIIAGQYQAASAGVNLQFVNYTVYYSPPLSSANYLQSLKRTNRIGQDKTTFYYRLITKDSVEEAVYETLAKGKDYSLKMFEEGKR